MRAWLATLGLALTLALGVTGCFDPDKPLCSYACSETDHSCPDDYECRTDNYCHRKGSTGECGFSAPADQSVPLSPPDLTTPANDLAESD
jgi:hypothetical protein